VSVRRVAHLSDLHFGRLDEEVLTGLYTCVRALKPDLLVVSGDFTQRARIAEFERARSFLQAFPMPRLVVPGNHDLAPWWHLNRRWRRPLARFQRYITPDLEPFYEDDELAVIGINTVRSSAAAGGRLNRRQVAAACERLLTSAGHQTRMVVTHHPFDLPLHHRGHDVVGRARMAMAAFARCGVDLILAGHLHVSHVGESARRYRLPHFAALVVQAGTAASTRARGELNSWNLIRIERPWIWVDRYLWDVARHGFFLVGTDRFQCTAEGWQRRPAAA